MCLSLRVAGSFSLPTQVGREICCRVSSPGDASPQPLPLHGSREGQARPTARRPPKWEDELTPAILPLGPCKCPEAALLR